MIALAIDQGGTTINAGFVEATASANALPSSGGIVVNSPGELWLNAGALAFNNAGGVGNGNPVTVNAGAKLTLASNFNAGYSRPVTLNGGTLHCLAGSSDDSNNYLCNLTLQNGAQVTGRKLRVGYHTTATVTASGTAPSTLAAGLYLVNNGPNLVFNVADVTGSAAADLTVSGLLTDFTGQTGMPVVKSGAGTLALSATNTCIARFTVLAGTLALATNGTLGAANNIVLSGGTLDMGSYTNTLGTLTVSTNSVIALGTGKLAFAASSAVTWTNRLTQRRLAGRADAALRHQQHRPDRAAGVGHRHQRQAGAAQERRLRGPAPLGHSRTPAVIGSPAQDIDLRGPEGDLRTADGVSRQVEAGGDGRRALVTLQWAP
jgi:autotransporter-associated beta strand protein